MKAIAAAALFVIVVSLSGEVSHAQPISADHERAIRELVGLLLGNIYAPMKARLLQHFTGEMKLRMEAELKRPLTSLEEPKLQGVVDRVWDEVFPRSLWEDAFLSIYAKHFTKDEVSDLVRFYRTPVGSKLSRLSGTLASEAAVAGETIARMRLREFEQRVEAEFKRELATLPGPR